MTGCITAGTGKGGTASLRWVPGRTLVTGRSVGVNGGFVNGHALLVGVGADLPVTVADATALRNVLVDPERGAYPPDRCASSPVRLRTVLGS